jgi:hypothetical protein
MNEEETPGVVSRCGRLISGLRYWAAYPPTRQIKIYPRSNAGQRQGQPRPGGDRGGRSKPRAAGSRVPAFGFSRHPDWRREERVVGNIRSQRLARASCARCVDQACWIHPPSKGCNYGGVMCIMEGGGGERQTQEEEQATISRGGVR